MTTTATEEGAPGTAERQQQQEAKRGEQRLTEMIAMLAAIRGFWANHKAGFTAFWTAQDAASRAALLDAAWLRDVDPALAAALAPETASAGDLAAGPRLLHVFDHLCGCADPQYWRGLLSEAVTFVEPLIDPAGPVVPLAPPQTLAVLDSGALFNPDKDDKGLAALKERGVVVGATAFLHAIARVNLLASAPFAVATRWQHEHEHEHEQQQHEQQQPRCASCGGKGLLACSRCKSAFYCSQSCQRAAWPQHKPVCKAPV
eukprot:TRINITY_DN449_c0_g3_i1.p1 TRINITY_DN449_c0_g3~~TRINITY_DN449_c0_g3_i1.p1  ORF type:complete len:259 (-),score=88.03 TRINITY_DN449_c0_g3_i1:55-831(-)